MSVGRVSCSALAILVLTPPLYGGPEKKGAPAVPTRVSSAHAFTRALYLDGRPFPKVAPFTARLPEPKRTLYVSPSGPDGDGSQMHPWNDLQAALRQLRPGDRLRILKGSYTGAFSIDAHCRDGTSEEPIQAVFERGELKPSGEGPLLSVERSYWILQGLHLPLEEHSGPGVAIASHDVVVDRAFIYRGRGPGVRVAPGASRVTIANATILKVGLTQPGPDSVGVEIAPRTREIRIVDCRLYENPAGSVLVDASNGEPEAADISVEGNSIHDDTGPAVTLLGGERIKVTGNTIFYGRRMRPPSQAIVLESAHDVEISGNHIADSGVAIRVGLADATGGPYLRSGNVTIARNAIETMHSRGTAIDIESGRGVRVANNVIEGYDDGVMVFGSPPQTETVSVANNLILSVLDVAFVLADLKAASYFDHNVVSPRTESVDVQVGKKTVALARFLKGGTMPHTKLVKRIVFKNRDLAAVEGVATVDAGKALEGISFKGKAPDLGAAEK